MLTVSPRTVVDWRVLRLRIDEVNAPTRSTMLQSTSGDTQLNVPPVIDTARMGQRVTRAQTVTPTTKTGETRKHTIRRRVSYLAAGNRSDFGSMNNRPAFASELVGAVVRLRGESRIASLDTYSYSRTLLTKAAPRRRNDRVPSSSSALLSRHKRS